MHKSASKYTKPASKYVKPASNILRDGLNTTCRLTKIQCWTVTQCSYLHGSTALGPSCNDFVYHGCWHFDNGATSKIDDVLTEHDELLHFLPIAVHQGL